RHGGRRAARPEPLRGRRRDGDGGHGSRPSRHLPGRCPRPPRRRRGRLRAAPRHAGGVRLMTTATVVVSMRSDWIVGSGRGRAGGIDATVQRDADGLPYIPAKTLTGVLRDAAERVVAIVEPGADGPWHEWLVWTFGAQPA